MGRLLLSQTNNCTFLVQLTFEKDHFGAQFCFSRETTADYLL